VIELSSSNSVQSYATQFGVTEVPTALAITNAGFVYVATSDLNGDGGCGFLLGLDPSTGSLSNLGPSGCLSTDGGVIGPSLASSADGTRIFFNDDGIFGSIDTASGQFAFPNGNDSNIGQGGYEVELNPTQTRLFVDGFFVDSNLNNIGLQVLNSAESIDAQYLYGAAFSADGALLFQPAAQAIDVFDGVTGAFRARVALPVALSPNFRALVSNGKDDRIIAVTGNAGDGIAVIDLSSLPEPPPVTWLFAIPAPAVMGNPQASDTASHRRLESPFPTIHHPASPLLRGLVQPRQ
jgi:hypothetical protein